MRVFAAVVLLFSCAPVKSPATDVYARRACTSEGMWCQDSDHARCCRGLACVDGTCTKRGDKSEKEQL